ncbi:MAG: transcription elongation factor GreA [Deltaproteobacteria bacterium]|nr:transcription elongation factor GreA [Deltaproteobacteria bacterium]
MEAKNLDKLPMTPEGKKKLEERLKVLKSVERPQNVKDIETARAHGDLSENADYSAAKERQGHIAMEMRTIEDRLARAQVIDPSKLDHDKIAFGATVTLIDIELDEKVTYQLVGSHEADIKAGKISVVSPIARALIGKKEGDAVIVKTPKGDKEYEIVSIKFI